MDRVQDVVTTAAFQQHLASRLSFEGMGTACFFPPHDHCITLRSHLNAIKSGRPLSEPQTVRVYSDLETHVVRECDVQALVSFFPESKGGLHPLAVGLLHPNAAIRCHTVVLLRRVEGHSMPSVRVSFTNLNYFMMVAYQRSAMLVANDLGPAPRRRGSSVAAAHAEPSGAAASVDAMDHSGAAPSTSPAADRDDEADASSELEAPVSRTSPPAADEGVTGASSCQTGVEDGSNPSSAPADAGSDGSATDPAAEPLAERDASAVGSDDVDASESTGAATTE